MRTTITLDDDAVAAVEALMRERHLGRSAAVNQLIRDGLVAPRRTTTYTPVVLDLGLRVDVTNVAEALELMDAWDHEEQAGPRDADRAG